MRKTITQPVSKDTSRSSESWLNLDHLAQVEVTSEEAANPVESALIPGPGPGWRAEQPGEQSIQLLFDQPLSLRLSIPSAVRRTGTSAHAAIRIALVAERRGAFPRNSAPAIYVQSA